MANQQHLEFFQQGAEAWNAWRKEHPEIQPDLCCTDTLKINLSHVDLSSFDLKHTGMMAVELEGANFNGADLSGACFTMANLRGANFAGANLSNAYLGEADLTSANFSAADLRAAIFHWATCSGTTTKHEYSGSERDMSLVAIHCRKRHFSHEKQGTFCLDNSRLWAPVLHLFSFN